MSNLMTKANSQLTQRKASQGFTGWNGPLCKVSNNGHTNETLSVFSARRTNLKQNKETVQKVLLHRLGTGYELALFPKQKDRHNFIYFVYDKQFCPDTKLLSLC